MHKIEGAHLQCVNNHCAKFEYKGMRILMELQITQTRHPQSIAEGKISKFTSPKNENQL